MAVAQLQVDRCLDLFIELCNETDGRPRASAPLECSEPSWRGEEPVTACHVVEGSADASTLQVNSAHFKAAKSATEPTEKYS